MLQKSLKEITLDKLDKIIDNIKYISETKN